MDARAGLIIFLMLTLSISKNSIMLRTLVATRHTLFLRCPPSHYARLSFSSASPPPAVAPPPAAPKPEEAILPAAVAPDARGPAFFLTPETPAAAPAEATPVVSAPVSVPSVANPGAASKKEDDKPIDKWWWIPAPKTAAGITAFVSYVSSHCFSF
jgi:hypothetical protein